MRVSEPPDDDGVGSRGFNSARFRFIRQLGAGGFGVVYLVEDLKHGGMVALKTLQGTRAEEVYRLKREFRSLADIRHRNLVRFYELFVEGERVYFTMEHVEGVAFLRHVRHGLEIDYPRLRNALSQLALGLSFLHQARKLHRDVKPSNVLVSSEERVVLLDFGLATEIEASKLGASIELAGTPDYMSPEQARGESLTGASDWYAVGIMLYQALTGRLPFQGGWAARMKERFSPVPPRELDIHVPEDLSGLCMSLLEPEPARRAGAREILAVVGDGAASSPRPVFRSDTLLFGREEELEQLEEQLLRVRGGEGIAVLVDGNSGVGKTSLVEHFLTRLRPSPAIVLRGRCYEREQVPYQGIDSLVDDLCRFLLRLDKVHVESLLPRHTAALVRLFPVLERVPAVAERRAGERFPSADERDTRRQAFAALRELLACIADHRTLIVHIDDLQWGDVDTAALLRDILRPPDAPIMLLILAYRREDQDSSPCVRVLAQEPIGIQVQLHLGPLSGDAAKALVRGILKSKQGEVDVDRLVQEADRDPFRLQELAIFELQNDSTGPSTPIDRNGALRSRIEKLPAEALKLLQTVAVAGHPVTEEVARRASGAVGSVVETLHLLLDEHLVRISGPADARLVESFHDRVRQAVVDSMTPQRIEECHRELASALEELGNADPEVLARHHLAARNIERARESTVRAATQATRALAFGRAARLLQQAVDLADSVPYERLALQAALGEALANAGRCVDSAHVYLEAAKAAGFEAGIPLRRRAANQFLFAGRIDDARALIEDDLRAQGFPVPKTRRATRLSLYWYTALVWRRGLQFKPQSAADIPPETLTFLEHLRNVAMVMSFVGLPWLGAQIGTRFVLRALELGERRLIALGTALLAAHAGAVAPYSRRTSDLFLKMSLQGRHLDDPGVRGTFLGIQGLHAYFQGAWRKAVQRLDEAETALQSSPDRLWELSSARHMAIWSRFYLGGWGELQERVFLGLADARDRGNAYGMAGICSPFGVAAWLSQDRPDEARRTLEEVRSLSVKGFPVQKYWFLMAESLVHLYLGEGLAAWTEILRRWRTANVPGFNVQLFHLRGSCALAAAEQSKDGAKRELLGEAERAAKQLARIDLPHALPLARLLWAGIALQRDSGALSITHLEEAMPGLLEQEMPVYAASARRQLASLRSEPAPEFLPGQRIANPDAIARMLVPGFRTA
jgi:eukaryotic-like serine/threonine-protein kinase